VGRSRPQVHPAAQVVVVVEAVVRTCRMGRVRRLSGGSVRGNRSVAAVAAEVAVAVLVVVVAGLGLQWDRDALLLGHRPVRRLLQTLREAEEERPRVGGRRGVFLRLLRLAPARVAHSVSDAAVWIDRYRENRG
jgi:hypothetical protein